MKFKTKRILSLLMVVMAIFCITAVPAFADELTAIGDGDVTAIVPVEGSITALTISVTHPATLAYTINPNTGALGDFIAPDIPITNNTKVPVNITVQSLAASTGGTIQFTDIADDAKDWANLNFSDSKTFIALGINVKDALGWKVGYDTNTHYAVKTDPTPTCKHNRYYDYGSKLRSCFRSSIYCNAQFNLYVQSCVKVKQNLVVK